MVYFHDLCSIHLTNCQIFKDVFAEKTLDNKLYFQEVSERVFNLYSRLSELSSEIEFKVF